MFMLVFGEKTYKQETAGGIKAGGLYCKIGKIIEWGERYAAPGIQCGYISCNCGFFFAVLFFIAIALLLPGYTPGLHHYLILIFFLHGLH